MKNKTLTPLILLLSLSTLASQLPADNNKTGCKPSQYILEYNFHDGTIQTITYNWVYDDQGRLINDSIIYSDSGTNYQGGSNYEYHGDVIYNIRTQYPDTKDTSYIKLNKQGVPQSEQCTYGLRYEAHTDAEGKLKRYEMIQAFVNKWGQLDEWHTVADSVIYNNGDIVSFRVSTHLKDSFYTVQCEYYDKEVSNADIYPAGNITGLSQNPMQYFGSVNVSLFSKHLLKKMESSAATLELDAMFDKHGRVQEFTKTYTFGYSGHIYSDRNIIKYECE